MDGSGAAACDPAAFSPKYSYWSVAMKPANALSTRRGFLRASAATTISAGLPASNALTQLVPRQPSEDPFVARQSERRKELWGLLGDLPWEHKPGPAKLLSKEEHEDYTLERIVLDLNGLEPVPALLLIPRKRQTPAPGLLYIHWHGGMYDLGKEMLCKGVKAAPAYAPACVQKGLVTLAIDSWCFGERKHEKDGHQGEENAFKLMLWNGRVLYGMMMFDEFRAMDYLASRPEVDKQRLGVLGMSMGSTKAWWLAALDSRVKLCMDVCCLTDYDELIKAHGLQGHGIYYYVPSLLRHFQTAEINELIVPRAHLSVNGKRDELTPPAGVDKVRDYLLPLYRKYGKEAELRVELFDCAHVELPEMRKLILEWMDRSLVATPRN
jgi:hypothetical protein